MECLRDYIGIKGCGATAPESGLYVNSLPGITSFLASKIADNEQITYLNVWRDVQDRAIRKFASSVIATFKSQRAYRIKTIAQMVDLGRLVSDASPVAASAQYRGISVELMFPGNIYTLESSLQVIYIQELNFFALAAGDVAFKIFDLDTAEELDTFTETVSSGWNKIRVATSYDAFRIFIAYDATAVESAALTIVSAATGNCQDCCDNIFGQGECEAAINGAAADTTTPTLISKASDTFGLSAIISIQCRYDWIVCGNKELFSNALLYLLGAELLWEQINSQRVNRYTTIDVEAAEKLRIEFLKEFDTEIGIAVNGIDISESDCCIECEAPVTKPYLLP